MAIKDVLTLINVQFNTNKLVQIDKIENDIESVRNEGKTRTFSIDFNPKKAFALLGLYIGVINAEAPTIFFEIVRTLLPG